LKRPKIDSSLYKQKSPTPLTPVDEAWNKMAEQLDSEIPVSDHKPKKRTLTISSSQLGILVVAAMILAGGGTFIALKSIENKKEIHLTKYPKLNSLINKTVQTDSSAIIPAETDIQTSINPSQKRNEEKMQPQQHSNNQTSLSTAVAKTNTPQEVALVEKTNQNNTTDDNTGLKTNKSDTTTSSIEERHETAFANTVDTINHQLNSTLPKAVDNYVLNTGKSDSTTNFNEEQYKTASVDTVNSQSNSILPKAVDNYVVNTNNSKNTTSPVEEQYKIAVVDAVNSQLNTPLPKVVDNYELNTGKSNSAANAIEKQPETAFVDTINSQLNGILFKNENVAKAELKTKPILNNSPRTERNSLNTNLSAKETEKIEHRGSNFSRYSYLKTNHIFIGFSGNSGLLFSKNESKNIYSYGGILAIGIRNTKHKLAAETGIGFQSLEYHVPYSRTLYTYQTTVTNDSTTTVSSYKYSLSSIIIPFFITKEILQCNTIFIDVKTGINTSIFLSKKRLFNQLPADVQLIDDSYPISKLNFAFTLSPQLRWDVNDKLSLNVNAGAVFYLNSLYQNNTLKPIGINLSAGIHYFL